MEYTTLGRTGLRASVMGLGCGGSSRLGRRRGADEHESVALVRRALELGVNLFDTAESYGTERIVGKALSREPREAVIVSTKKTSSRGGRPIARGEIGPALEQSLRRLGMDYVDIYHVHGLSPRRYEPTLHELVPELLRLRDQGKFRFLGVTEVFGRDTGHEMLRRALRDDCWDVVMVGFNILNQTARECVFPATQAGGIGTLVMFALRRALSDPAHLRKTLADLSSRGLLPAGLPDDGEALEFLVHEGGATSLQDAAYRFCRHEPGVHVVLSGTGSVEHLERNAASLSRPPLPAGDVARLRDIFARVTDVSGA